MNEKWRDVPGYEGLYRVSDQGRVFNIKRNRYIGLTKKEYNDHLRLHLYKNGEGKSWGKHQLVLLAFVGECPDGMEVNHINGLKSDNRLSNLEYTTHSDNLRHAYISGLTQKWSKDTAGQVLNLYAMGWQCRKIGEYLGITKQRVSQILKAQGVNVRGASPRKGGYIRKGTKRGIPLSARTRTIIKMYRDGVSTTEIAREAGASAQEISTILGRHISKEERRHKRRTTLETAAIRQRIRELKTRGHNTREIAEMCVVSVSYVYQVCGGENV